MMLVQRKARACSRRHPAVSCARRSVLHSGAFYARELEVQAGAKIDYVPSQVTWFPNGPNL
jgi:hypothetical protein